MNEPLDVINIKLDERTSLVVWKNYDPDFNEISVYITKDGYIYQDLALVRQKYKFDDEGEIVHIPGEYEVLVWADKDNEDYTDKFEISEHKE